MITPRSMACAIACAALAVAIPALAHDDDHHHGDNKFQIEVLSSKPHLVSGGDALVRVTVKNGDVRLSDVRVE